MASDPSGMVFSTSARKHVSSAFPVSSHAMVVRMIVSAVWRIGTAIRNDLPSVLWRRLKAERPFAVLTLLVLILEGLESYNRFDHSRQE